MAPRSLVSTAALIVPITVSLLATATLAGQTNSYAPPRTPDGQPDSSRASGRTPPTRRSSGRMASPRSSITPQEAAEVEKRAARARGRDADRHRARSRTCTTTSASSGWTAARCRARGALRTSLILDPPDGKIPPLTAEAKTTDGRAGGGRPGAWAAVGTPRRANRARRSLPHHAWCRTADDGRRLQQQLPDRAGAWIRDDSAPR